MICSVAPKLESDRTLEATRSYRAGTTITQTFTVSGVPTPVVTWTLDGKPLDATAVSSSSSGDLTSLNVKNCTVTYGGQYEVTATNDIGSDQAKFVIVVNGEWHRILHPQVNKLSSVGLACLHAS